MAFGFPPKYETERELLGDRQAALDAVAYAFEILCWKYRTSDSDHFSGEGAGRSTHLGLE
jgi:hypothetical protein